MSADNEKAIKSQMAMSSAELKSIRPEDELTSRLAIQQGVAIGNEASLLVLAKLGSLESDIRELKRRVTQHEAHGAKAADLLLEERKSRFELEEEVTRTDLVIKKAKSDRTTLILTRVLAVLATPAALAWLWDLIKKWSTP